MFFERNPNVRVCGRGPTCRLESIRRHGVLSWVLAKELNSSYHNRDLVVDLEFLEYIIWFPYYGPILHNVVASLC